MGRVPFRLAETPVFLPKATGERLVEHARGIVAELSTERCLAAMRPAVPAHYDVPRRDALPACVQVDFALVRDDKGELDGKIVELQAFPSLYAFQSSRPARGTRSSSRCSASGSSRTSA